MDVVIVGGGSAGLLCALGLADYAHVTVVEAGVDPGSPAPARYLDEHLYPDCDWDYAEADRGYHLVRGKVLGGSSTVNASAAVRGQPVCFADWGPGWQWDDVVGDLCAIETDEQFGAEPYHGDAGPVVVTRLPQGALDDAFDDAARSLGFPACPDHNAPGALGTGPWPTNRVGGGRWGTLPAVAPLLRDRVDIRSETEVLRLVVDGGRVTGVAVTDGSGASVIDADLVVLSAGVFGTPEILARSGLATGAVGAGLMDHPWAMLDVEADADAILERPVSGGLLRHGLDGDPTDEIQVFPFSAHIYEPDAPRSVYRMSVGLMAPRSRGSLDLAAAKDGGRAGVHLNHLALDEDAERFAAGVRTAGDVLDAMADAGAVTLPADPWWRATDLVAAVREQVTTYNHPVGTCAIGTVVDDRLRVPDVDGLRIADASVMPRIPRANTNLISMMIGHRAARFVVEDEI